MKVPFKSSTEFINSVEDIDGDLYWCKEARDSGHGFYIWFGYLEHKRGGAPSAVLTQEVADHMEKCCYSYKKADLPVSDRVWRTFRKRLGVPNPHDKEYREYKKSITPPPLMVRDIDKARFKVTQKHDCELGIPIYQGVEIDKPYSSSQFILTPALAAIIKEWADFSHKLVPLLPFDIQTLVVLRKRLKLDWHEGRHIWWSKRLDDLLTLTPEEFSSKHGKTPRTVFDERSAIRSMIKKLENRELHVEFFIHMEADWSDRQQNVMKTLGMKQYLYLRRNRRAYNVLKAAGKVDEAA